MDCIVSLPHDSLSSDIPQGALVFLRHVKAGFQEKRFYWIETAKITGIGKVAPITDCDYLFMPSVLHRKEAVRLRKEELTVVYEVCRILVDFHP